MVPPSLLRLPKKKAGAYLLCGPKRQLFTLARHSHLAEFKLNLINTRWSRSEHERRHVSATKKGRPHGGRPSLLGSCVGSLNGQYSHDPVCAAVNDDYFIADNKVHISAPSWVNSKQRLRHRDETHRIWNRRADVERKVDARHFWCAAGAQHGLTNGRLLLNGQGYRAARLNLALVLSLC